MFSLAKQQQQRQQQQQQQQHLRCHQVFGNDANHKVIKSFLLLPLQHPIN